MLAIMSLQDYEAKPTRNKPRTNNGGNRKKVVKVLALEENQLIVLLNQGEIYTREKLT